MSDTAKREATKKATKTNGHKPAAPAVSANAEEWRATTYRRAVERAPERQPSFTTSSEIEVAAALHRRGPARLGPERSSLAIPASIPTRAASSRRCIADASGRCASTPASPPPRSPTSATATCWSRARPASRSPSTCRRRWATTPIIRWRRARSARSASRSPASRTCARSSTASRWRRITTSMTINATAAILLALYIAVASEQGADIRKLSGTVQNDILKEYIARGTYIYPPAPSMRIITDLFRYCADEVPRWNTISITGYHIREAGSHRRAGDRLHALQRHRLRAGRARRRAGRGRLRRAAVVLLQRPQQLLRGGRQVPRGAAHVGEDHARALRREGRSARCCCASTRRRPARP